MSPRKNMPSVAARQLALWGLGLSVSWGTAVADPQQTAQPQAEPPLQEVALQEVVVTAQKRSQNIQTVPIAISAFTSQQLQRKLRDVAQEVTETGTLP